MTAITVTDPVTGLRSVVDSNEAQQAHGADAQGNYLGLVPFGSATTLPGPPPDDGMRRNWRFVGGGWVSTHSFLGARAFVAGLIQTRIAAIELSQARPVRSILVALAASSQPAAADVQALKGFDDSVKQLRAALATVAAATTFADLAPVQAAFPDLVPPSEVAP